MVTPGNRFTGSDFDQLTGRMTAWAKIPRGQSNGFW
jgi:hypothetical protein